MALTSCRNASQMDDAVYRSDARMRINYVPNRFRVRDSSLEQTNLSSGADWKFSTSQKFRNSRRRKYKSRAFLVRFPKASRFVRADFGSLSILQGKKGRWRGKEIERKKETHKSFASTKRRTSSVAMVALFAAQFRAECGMCQERAR
jgi:hypothetical protein